MSANAVRAPWHGAHETVARDASRRALKLPLRHLIGAGVLLACIALPATMAALTLESPAGPLASQTLRLERAQTIALDMAPPTTSDWRPATSKLLPVTGEAHECLFSAAPPAC
jgi:hypothetical protein